MDQHHFLALGGGMSESEYEAIKSLMQKMKAPPYVIEALHSHYQKHKMEQVTIQNKPKHSKRRRAIKQHRDDNEITVVE